MLDLDNVRVLQESKQLDFTKNPCSIRNMLKDVLNAFDGHALSREVVEGGADDAVGAFADHLLHSEPPRLDHPTISSGKERCREFGRGQK